MHWQAIILSEINRIFFVARYRVEGGAQEGDMRRLPRQGSGLRSLFHKSVVMTCAGLTVMGFVYTTGLLHYHYTFVLPQREQEEQDKLMTLTTTVVKQDKEELRDIAPTIRV